MQKGLRVFLRSDQPIEGVAKRLEPVPRPAQGDAEAPGEQVLVRGLTERLAELEARPSLLNPLWYAGAFGLGLIAGRLGDRISLGFVVETERQVEAHLESHLDRLPANDHASRAIVVQMKDDEAAHAAQALQAGGIELPAPAKALMRAAAKVMTTTAHYV